MSNVRADINKKVPWFDKVLVTVAIVMVFMVMIDAAIWAAKDRRDPIEISEVQTLNSPIQPGGVVVVRVIRKKVRDCPIASHRTAVDKDGQVWPLGTVVAEQGGPVDREFVDVAYPIPPDLPPGEYILRVVLSYSCKDGNHVIRQPDAPFRVEASR